MKTKQVVTLSQFIVEEQSKHIEATGDLSKLFRDIKLAAKIINRDVRKAGLVDILGEHGSVNVQGEEVKKLDIIANEELAYALTVGGQCAGIISEEEDGIRHCNPEAHYVVAFDPLDGSSNIDINAPIGTIFSIFKRVTPVGTQAEMKDFLQKGTEQIAAGYVLYGSSTMMILTTGNGVNGFTLDISIGDFCLSHPNIQTPDNGTIYSINEGNYDTFPAGVKQYIKTCKEQRQSLRYIGSMVGDMHRTLLKGGIFIYPSTESAPSGKLRLLYECNPMSFLMEQSGGTASDGTQRILEIQPTELHQRVPIYIGSNNNVDAIKNLL